MNSLIDGTTRAMHQQHRLEFIALHTRYITRTQQTRVIGSVSRPMSKYQSNSQASCMLTDDQAIGKRTKVYMPLFNSNSHLLTHRIQCPRLNSTPAIC